MSSRNNNTTDKKQGGHNMPKLSCTVTKCGHNEDKLCSLNSIEIAGGEKKDNT